MGQNKMFISTCDTLLSVRCGSTCKTVCCPTVKVVTMHACTVKCSVAYSRTRNILDCDQSNYSSHIIFSPVFLQSCSVIHESGSDNSFQRYGHLLDLVRRSRKPYPRIKHEVDRTIRSRDIAIWSFPRWRPAAILDLVQPEVGPFDPPTSKTLP